MTPRTGVAMDQPAGTKSPSERQSTVPERMREDFAILIPAYNEVENIAALFAAIRESFARHGLNGEVVLVDDGSTDGTYERAVEEGRGIPRLTLLRHRRNRGKTEAMVTGAEAVTSEYVILFDADLQHSPEEFPRFLKKLAEGWDIVAGRKVGAYEKRAVSSVYNAISQRLFEVPARDLNSIKAFRREILTEIPLRHDWHRFFIVLAHTRGYTITEMDVELFPRHAGVAKYSGGGRILVGVGDLLVVWFYLRFSEKPMQFFGGWGLFLIVLGVVVGFVTVVLRVAGLMPPFGFRPLLTLVLLLETVGFMLFGFGFVGEMVAIVRSELDELRRRR
ncbi:MAG: glycosyltransferase [Gemmatimonadetes bacterium]|nr:glycosyltransferase [Gemmatimonadota bacterium]